MPSGSHRGYGKVEGMWLGHLLDPCKSLYAVGSVGINQVDIEYSHPPGTDLNTVSPDFQAAQDHMSWMGH